MAEHAASAVNNNTNNVIFIIALLSQKLSAAPGKPAIDPSLEQATQNQRKQP
jgi:hypothetical protein